MEMKYGSETVIISKSAGDYYCAAVAYASAYGAWITRMRRDGYTINALLRGGEKGELTLIDQGGPFRDYFRTGKGSRTCEKCRVRHVSLLKEDEISRWCDPYQAEDEYRYVWMTSDQGKFHFSWCARIRRADHTLPIFQSHLTIYDQKAVDLYSLHECLISQSKRHDLIHDPWNPDYPDLHGMTLKDLQAEEGSITGSGKMPQPADDQIRKMAKTFFSSDRILLSSGRRPGPQEREASFRSLLKCMRTMKQATWMWGGEWTCRPGYFGYRCEREVSCYDGGNCGTDTESMSLIFEINREDRPSWEDLIRESEKANPNRTSKEVLDRWKYQWMYSAVIEDSEKTPILVGEFGTLYLKDPFGLKGVFQFRAR